MLSPRSASRRRLPRVAPFAAALTLFALGMSPIGSADDDTPDRPSTREEIEAELRHAENHGEPTEEELVAIMAEIEAREAEEAAELEAEAERERLANLPPEGSVEAVVGHSRSVSMGRAANGLLRRGVPVPDDPVVSLKSSSQGEHYGTAELVTLILWGARHVAREFPGSRLVVGDLSREGGGRLRPHRSHRSGRDVDLGFYLSDDRGRALETAPSFVHMNGSLLGSRRGSAYRFDIARNWTLVAALLSHPDIHPQYLFVARPMIRALLDHARRRGASDELRSRAARVLDQPRGSPHRSHFHLRIFCPEDDRPACEDDPPMYPWVRGDQDEESGGEAGERASEQLDDPSPP